RRGLAAWPREFPAAPAATVRGGICPVASAQRQAASVQRARVGAGIGRAAGGGVLGGVVAPAVVLRIAILAVDPASALGARAVIVRLGLHFLLWRRGAARARRRALAGVGAGRGLGQCAEAEQRSGGQQGYGWG